MKKVNNKSQFKAALNSRERVLIVENSNMLKAMAVAAWIQRHKIKGAILLATLTAALTTATVCSAGTAPAIMGVMASGLTVGGIVISATELFIIAALILGIIALLNGYNVGIEVDLDKKRVYLTYKNN